MGKKSKIGKTRRDKFYHLAKETGFRSRAAFKLIQLNRKYEFLQKSRIVIDLCAAPGGWTQVAAQNTPMSSMVIGIDLVPIKPIPKAVTIQADITTEQCRQAIKKEIQTWKADCILNDGAPNIGKNWLHDAFQQAQLTLQALKLATFYLKRGGWFVTKVFRSNDYFPLMWVFKQLFAKVHATKPQASRMTSAEIFVVCEGYLAPDKIDPKFLDPRHVFELLEEKEKKELQQKQRLDLIHPEKRKRQREGYAKGDYTLFHTLKASEFINGANHLELLAAASEVVLDDDHIKNNSATTPEIIECLKDIKVLGKKEIKRVIKWRKKIKMELDGKVETKQPTSEEHQSDDSEAEDEKIREQLTELQREEKKTLKKKQKKIRQEKTKLQHKMDMKMIIPGDKFDLENDRGLFSVSKIKKKKDLDVVQKGDLSMMDVGENHVESDDDEVPHQTRCYYDKDDDKSYLDPSEQLSDDDEPLLQYMSDDDDECLSENPDDEDNPLLVPLQDRETHRKSKMNDWFSKKSFTDLLGDVDEDDGSDDSDDDSVTDRNKRNTNLTDIKYKKKTKTVTFSDKVEKNEDSDNDDSDSDSDSDIDSEDYDESDLQMDTNSARKKKSKARNNMNKDGFEVVPVQTDESLRLDPLGLAIGGAMVQSRKRKRDIIDDGYHRYMFDDEHLPDWFSKDETKHHHRQLPVTKEEIARYKERLKAINLRPIKKIAQAKARRMRKQLRKQEKARKKSEVITDALDVSEKEKMSQIKQIYKKAGLLNKKKKEVSYVVAKKVHAGKKVHRPAGVSGPYKVVDKRMKKDNRSKKQADKQKGRKPKSGKKRK